MASHSSVVHNVLKISIPWDVWIKNEVHKKTKRHRFIDDIKKCICALLNSGGGELILTPEIDKNTAATENLFQFQDVFRAIEQHFHGVIGTACVSSHLTSSSREMSKIILVKALYSLCTLSYNMYLPTETQVLPINSDELDTVVDLLDFNRVVDVTDFENSPAINQFVKNSLVEIKECKIVQFKHLKSEKSEHNDLAARIISNKFTSYVSAFANHIGGRIYIGIEDTGRIVGQTIGEKEQKLLGTRLEQQMTKSMLWPDHCSPPVKDKQWKIEFHKVVAVDDEDDDERVVIVITVYACPGGVFVRMPESYHVVDGKVEAIDFPDWKARIRRSNNCIPRSMSKCEWSSQELRKKCDALDGKLLRHINYGEWQDFKREASKNQPKAETPDRVELELVLLSKWYVYRYRKGEKNDFQIAHELMAEFEEKLCKSKDNLVFQVRGRLCYSALQRTRGDHEGSYRTARECLSDVDKLSPCILTAEYYVHFATVLTIVEGNEELREKLKGDLYGGKSFKDEAMVFYEKALEHLRLIDYVPLSKADMQQKCHINIAILKLGCSLSGDVVEHVVSADSINTASECLKRVHESTVQDANPLSSFRCCHFNFAISSLYYRRSQHETQPDKRMNLLTSALRNAEDVEFRAGKCKFYELSNYAQKHAQVYQDELKPLRAMNEQD